MSTGHMPEMPDQPTSKAPAASAAAQTQANPQSSANAATPEGTASAQPQFDLASDVANIIQDQADIIAQRLWYHCQMMYGVSAHTIDIVNARNSTLIVANALRNNAEKQAVSTLVNMGTPQNSQINDGTLPFRNNQLVAGLFEGILHDAVAQAYRDNPDRTKQANLLLDGYFQTANEQLQSQTRAIGPVTLQASQGSGGGPNARS